MRQADSQEHKSLPKTEVLLKDLRFALRILGKNPRFTTIAILILALGIGANTAIFSLVEGVLLRPLDYAAPERLYTIREVVPKLSKLYPTLPANAKHFSEWQKESTSFEDMAQMERGSVSLTGAGEPERIQSCNVSWNFFQVLGTQPKHGRWFFPEEDQPGRNNVAVISDSLWRRRFNADSSIIEKKIILEGEPYTIIGILPAGFRYPDVGSESRAGSSPEIFKPMGLDLSTVPDLGDFNYEVIARTRVGITRQQALTELNTIQARIGSRLPGNTELLATIQPLQDAIVGSSRQSLVLLFAAVGAILLIVCVNLASLYLARAKRREREFAVRVALGASRGRLMQQLLTESLVLALLGGVLGVILAEWGVRMLVNSAPVDLPRLNEVRLNGTVLLFALVVSSFAGTVIGMLPAWRLLKSDANEKLKTAGSRTTEGRLGVRVRELLVGAEVSISLVLLVGAGLLLLSFIRVSQVNKGFETHNVLTVSMTLPSTKYQENESIDRFYTQMLERIQSVPGVESAGLVSMLPLQGESWVDAVTLEGDTRPITERPQANYRFISPNYFKAVGIGLSSGRVFTEDDRKIRAAMISESAAQALWPGQNPIGLRFKRSADKEQPFEIVGVVADARTINLEREPGLMVYVPYWERLRPWASLVVRSSVPAPAVAAAVRSAIWQIDDQVPLDRIQTMEQLMDRSVAQRRFQLSLVLLFAISALLLASIGIYGVVAESVASRTNEIGIRMALGADGGYIQRMVVREGMMPVAVGMIVGLVISLALGRVLSSLLFEVQPSDPMILAFSAAVMILVAITACYLPARRASRVDPLIALRDE